MRKSDSRRRSITCATRTFPGLARTTTTGPSTTASTVQSCSSNSTTSHESSIPQPGIVSANAEPTRDHIHTVVRTPNGNDYGKDLLRQHYARHDHSHPRSAHRLGKE